MSFYNFKETRRGVKNMNEEDKKKIIEAIVNSNDHYKNNDEAVKGLKKSLEQVEAVQKGKLPAMSGREFFKRT